MAVMDAEFNKAVACLAGMSDQELAKAGMVCRLGQARAMGNIKEGDNRRIACEMAAMFGEVCKEMARRMVRAEGNFEGMTEDEAIAKCDKETEASLKELDAA